MPDSDVSNLKEYRANASFGTPGGPCIIDRVYLLDPTQFADLIDAGWLSPADDREAAPMMNTIEGDATPAPVETLTVEPNSAA